MPADRPIAKSPNHQIDTVYPLRHFPDHVEPFPTIYYLTDPALLHAMSELERQQFIGRFEQRLRDDADLMAAYHADHVQYRDTRWAMLTDADRAIVEASASLSRSFRGGIAGIANFDTVKCLHAHYAHHLAAAPTGGTTIGRLIDEQLKPRN
ncbi:MAG: DUF501 domain-containing protein [Planctomycetota bacterium]